MPLIIAVLVIVVVFLSAKGFNKENDRKQREYTAAIRKTNAELELKLVNKYVNSGKTLDEAVNLMQSDLSLAGFEPCIPRTSYSVDTGSGKVSIYPRGHSYQDFDSKAVKSLREDFRRETKKSGVKFSSRKEFEEQCEKYVYDNLPKTNWQYELYLTRAIRKLDAIDVGKFISYPGLGTCEVVALDYEKMQHTVKVVETGQLTKIAFGDKHIIRL